jgi:hypothetical protein
METQKPAHPTANGPMNVGRSAVVVSGSPHARVTVRTSGLSMERPIPTRYRPLTRPALAALTDMSCQSHSTLQMLIKKATPISDENALWKTVSETLGHFEKEPSTTMQLMSLIRPEVWKQNRRWIKYHEEIRRIAQNAVSGMTRRLHIVDSTTAGDARHLGLLLNLVVSEYLCRIRARVLILDDRVVEDLKADMGHFNRCNSIDFTPFDCATITSQSGRYAVIFSDIRPYFIEDRSSPFAILSFPDAGNFVYYALRANFYRAWHHSNTENLLCLSSLYRKTKSAGLTNPIDKQELAAFLGENGALSYIPSAEELCQVLDGITPPTLQHTMAEKERQIEQQLSSLRGRDR